MTAKHKRSKLLLETDESAAEAFSVMDSPINTLETDFQSSVSPISACKHD